MENDNMKTIPALLGVLLSIGLATSSFAAGEGGTMEKMMHHNKAHDMNDDRTVLKMSPQMKQHQLLNMRSNVEAVQSIVGFLAKGEFDQAAQVAHSKLGLTVEMKTMSGMFGNEKFRSLAVAFHESGDELGNALQAKDMNKSLQALQVTMGYCVQCHATFRQQSQ